MSSVIELQHIFNIQNSLSQFKWISRNRIGNFRCPYCGDSKKNPLKARGYLYIKKDRFYYNCKNCGVGRTFYNFIKDQFPERLNELRLDVFRDKMSSNKVEIVYTKEPERKAPEINKELPRETFKTLNNLPDDHIAVQYVKSRKIPMKWNDYLGYVPNFKDFVINSCGITCKDKIESLQKIPTDQRLIIPFYDEEGELFGFQGRSLSKYGIRYITIKIDEEKPKLFGRDLFMPDLPAFLTEGPIDSMFMPNGLAICGGDITREVLSFVKPEFLYVALDNEPRSKDTVKRMEKAISLGYNVCFWNIDTRYKDINSMILDGGMTRQQIMRHIIQNSASGAQAKLKLMYWKKI